MLFLRRKARAAERSLSPCGATRAASSAANHPEDAHAHALCARVAARSHAQASRQRRGIAWMRNAAVRAVAPPSAARHVPWTQRHRAHRVSVTLRSRQATLLARQRSPCAGVHVRGSGQHGRTRCTATWIRATHATAGCALPSKVLLIRHVRDVQTASASTTTASTSTATQWTPGFAAVLL